MADRVITEIGERSLLPEGTTFHQVTDSVARVTENPAPRGWWILFIPSVILSGVLFACIAYLVTEGIGVWGNNNPVAWAWDITNFVWWIGIGHAGTLISAILFLFRQKWRTSINRFAEAMTIFAVMCAGIYPALHTGRPWFDYYMFPLPNQMAIWPNFKSPLMWDVFAVSTYFTISLLFWITGLIPDFATLRDRSTNRVRRLVYGFLALGWRGSNRHWQHYERLLRLRDLGVARLAYDHLPALFRRRRRLQRLRPGHDLAAHRAYGLRPQACRDDEAPRADEQNHARDRHAGRIRLWHGVLHRLVLGQ